MGGLQHTDLLEELSWREKERERIRPAISLPGHSKHSTPPTSLPPLTMAGSSTVTTGYFKDLNFLISSQHTAQTLCSCFASCWP